MVDIGILLTLVLVKLGLHLAFNRGYGYFRDELYYFACGERLSWGYVDHPPLIAAIVRLTRAWLGSSLFAVRLLPALAGAAKVGLSIYLAAQLGAGPLGQAITGLAVLIAPIYLILDNMLTMNAFEPVFWLAAACVVQALIGGADPRWWLLFGAVAGLGVLNKYSMLFFAVCLLAGLVAAGRADLLATRWFWAGGAVAAIIVAPHAAWQIRHGFPSIELQRISRAKNRRMSFAGFLAQQAYVQHPFTAPLWVLGIVAGLAGDFAPTLRHLSVTYLALLLLTRALQGKGYYLTPVYPLVIAAGALVAEQLLAGSGSGWAAGIVIALLVIGGLLTAPMGLPMLPPRLFLRYWRVLGTRQLSMEDFDPGRLPQHYADMFGWESLTKAVADVYDRLSESDRRRCTLFAHNYGQAGAIAFFGERFALPSVISGHQHYFLWGPGSASGDLMIVVGGDPANFSSYFEHVELAAVSNCELSMPYEQWTGIFICRGMHRPLQDIWPAVRMWT